MNRISFLCFLSVVITIYSLMNYYFISKHSVLAFSSFLGVAVRMILFSLMLTPVLAIIFNRYGHLCFAVVTGFIGYSWLAFLFLFLAIHFSIDAVLFLIHLLGLDLGPQTAKIVFLFTMLTSISILFYGRHEAEKIKIEQVLIETNKIDKAIRIVQLSDIHFSMLTGVKTAKKLARLVRKQNPDLIVLTGDFIDRGIQDKAQIASVFSALQAPLGKYAVTGNHEFIAGIEESSQFIENSGFKLLRNESICVDNMLNIAAVDDKSAKMFGEWKAVPEEHIFAGLDSSKYTLFLKHQPRINKKSLGLFDFQLSGHTHAGQIFPFSLLVKLFFPYLSGLYDLDDETKLYVSRGAGTWGPPFRFLASPEITVIDIERGKNAFGG